MVLFNELRISDDKKYLIIDCSVEGLSIYSDVYISSIYIDYYKNVTEGSGGVPELTHAFCVYNSATAGETVQNVRRRVCQEELPEDFGTATFDGGVFYVLVTCEGVPAAETSLYACGTDDMQDIAIVPDWKKMYSSGMGFVSQMARSCGDGCAVPSGFEQFVLLWHAFKLALTSCDIRQIGLLWDKFLKFYPGDTPQVGSGCGCRG